MSDPVMSVEELQQFLHREFPQVADQFLVEEVGPLSARIRMRVRNEHLRPGGTVSGPSMFALADVSVYLAILAAVGPMALAVTTNCSIDFMRKPPAGTDLIATAQLLKLGKVLAVGDVRIVSVAETDKPVCRASLTYSLPKR